MGKRAIWGKVIFGVSGTMLVLFLILHLAVNLTALASREAYEAAWQFMHSSAAARIIVPALAAGIIVHIAYGVVLSLRSRKADGTATVTMLTWGVLIIGFLVLHLIQFRTRIELQGQSPYDVVKTLFYNGFYTAVYVLWILALYFHMSRGFWNVYRSLGPSGTWLPRAQAAATVLSTLIAAGFISIPVYFYLGFGHA